MDPNINKLIVISDSLLIKMDKIYKIKMVKKKINNNKIIINNNYHNKNNHTNTHKMTPS